MPPRALAHFYFGSILACGAATGVVLALVFMKFLSRALMAAMGDACSGIFEASQGFLAASRWNYLLAVLAAALFFSQLAFLLGGGTRLIFRSSRLRKLRAVDSIFCPALGVISGKAWSRHIRLAPARGFEAQTVGLARPRILFQAGLVDILSGDELLAVAEHEEAHRKGRDNLLVAAAKVVSLTLFYLPGPGMAFKEMRRCLERAADRKAVAATGGPLYVASALARIINLSRPKREAAVVVSPVRGNDSLAEITARLEYLMKEDKYTGGRLRLPVLVAASATILLVFTSSAFAVAGYDQRDTLVCFAEHAQGSPENGVCELGPPGQEAP